MVCDIYGTEILGGEVVVDVSTQAARVEAVSIGARVAGDFERGVDGGGDRAEVY